MKRFLYLSMWFVLFALVGCASAPDTSQPPDIVYGEDMCEECGMIISEPRFAAAYYTTTGESRRFDEIGGMCIYHNEHHEEVATFWVHDYDTEEWLDATEAIYVMGSDLYTPMAFGVVAFGDHARAEALATDVQGRVMSFDEVMAHFAEDGADHDHTTHDGDADMNMSSDMDAHEDHTMDDME